MIKIVVAGINGCHGSAFVGLTDALELARRAIAHATGQDAPFYMVTASSDGAGIVDGFGRRFDIATSFEAISACDAILAPGFQPDEAGHPPSMSHLSGVAAWIRRQHSRGALVCGAGTGVFLLGEAGLLDGRRCTTGWRSIDELKRRYPRAAAARDAMLIEDRRVVTAGAPLSWIDLALYCIRTLCGDAAARIAGEFTVFDTASSGLTAYQPNGYLSGLNPFLIEAERIVRQAGDSPLSASDLARVLSTSERTLHRRLKQACGESPKAFIDRVRVDAARTLLETSGKSIKELASSAGFVDEASFRRAFRRYAGMAPGAYRVLARVRNQPKGHVFAMHKSAGLIPEMLTQILDSCVNGVTLADPDQEDAPIVYANKEFQRITGFSLDDIIGQNCRFLQGADRDQEGRARLREAIEKREHVEVTLRNYRKDGSLFYNGLSITPLFDARGQLLYLLGIQHDATAQVQAEAEIGALKARLTALSGNGFGNKNDD
jgi:PAS domain S-box-containing protein